MLDSSFHHVHTPSIESFRTYIVPRGFVSNRLWQSLMLVNSNFLARKAVKNYSNANAFKNQAVCCDQEQIFKWSVIITFDITESERKKETI